MKIGFTGTQRGMTSRQKEIFRERLRANMGVHPNEFHHGDCIGADEEACDIAIEEGFEIHCHPPHNDSKRAHTVYDVLYPSEDYLVRNHIIVDSVSQMISTPKEKEEQLRSGTWATIRYTKKKGVPLDIIYP